MQATFAGFVAYHHLPLAVIYTHTPHTHNTERERERERDRERETQTHTRHRHTFMEATYTNRAKSIKKNHAESTSLQHHTRTHAHQVPYIQRV